MTVNKVYNQLLKDIKWWENSKAILMQYDTDLLHEKKMQAYKSGHISYEQAIKLENRIDKLWK